jgi:hypothetical protein
VNKVDIKIIISPQYGQPYGSVVTMYREGVEGAIQLASGQHGIEARALQDFVTRSVVDAVIKWAETNPDTARVIERRKLAEEMGGPITVESLHAHILSKLNG